MLLGECELLKLDGILYTGAIGLFKVKIPGTDECVEIDSDAFKEIDDTAWKCARVCGVLALVFGVILATFIVFQQWIVPLPCSQRIMDASSTLTQIFLALVYVIWMAEACDLYSCNYGDGITLLFLTQIFWLVSGCFTRCMRPGRSQRRNNEEDGKQATRGFLGKMFAKDDKKDENDAAEKAAQEKEDEEVGGEKSAAVTD